MSTSHGEQSLPRLIYKGAEADVYLEQWLGELAIRKTRIPKPYRITELDEGIRRMRTLHEANMMREVRKLGVPVPALRHVDTDSSTLIMEYVQGPTLKEELNALLPSEQRANCMQLGGLLARMHEGGIVHGDMTISNVISEQGKLFLIDFALGSFSIELESRGVDVLLLNRAIRSTHYSRHALLFRAFLGGYQKISGKKTLEKVVQKMKDIERRGRYFERQ